VKDPIKLQHKLLALLKTNSKYPRVNPPANGHWSSDDLAAVAWVMQDYVNLNDEVVDSDDPLRQWLDEFKFYLAENKVR